MFIDVTKLNMPKNHNKTARFNPTNTLPSGKIEIGEQPSIYVPYRLY